MRIGTVLMPIRIPIWNGIMEIWYRIGIKAMLIHNNVYNTAYFRHSFTNYFFLKITKLNIKR